MRTTAAKAIRAGGQKALAVWEGGKGHLVMLAAIRQYASEAERARTGQRGQGTKLVESSPVPSGAIPSSKRCSQPLNPSGR
jgi:hypothetical protein